MSVRVQCQCGTSYELKDEFAGRLVKCPQCGTENRAPATAVARPQADLVFDRDVFLLRQQMLRISEKYDVCDEQGNKIVFVERPAHLLQNLGAMFAGLIASGVVVAGALSLADLFPKDSVMQGLLLFLSVAGFFVSFTAVYVWLAAKRHVTFYRDQTKRDRLLEVLQDKKWQPIKRTYTVRDPSGQTLALFTKNHLYDVVRKRWLVLLPDGTLWFMAKEDSVILSLLRRLMGPLYGLLRTNFIFVHGDADDVIGEFNRKFTILDRYVLDLKADPQRHFDRRVALALGVMLDTGERR